MTINEVLEALTPENARFVSGQDLFLYVPKAQTNKRYGLAKYSPDDFSIDSNGVLTLLLPKSQIEDYFTEVYGGTRNETVLADPAINLLNLDKTDKDLYKNITRLDGRVDSEISRVDSLNLEIYGASGRAGTVLKDINLTTLNATDLELKNKDIELQKNIDDIIQDDQPSSALNSTYSASKITQLIKDAKMEGLHFVGFIGSEVGKDYNGESLIKEGALWHVSDETTSPTITDEWDADTMYQCIGGEWIKTNAYTPQDFDIWKNVNIPDSQINSWWYFEGTFEVLDFTVDMNLYYTKVESDARYYTKTDADARYYTKSVSDERFKSNFSYGNYLSETNSVLNIDTDTLPTKGSLTSFVQGQSELDVDDVESAIKLLETKVNAKFLIIDDRSRILDKGVEPTRANDYAVDENGVYISQESIETPGTFEWVFKTKDLTTLLPRLNVDRYIVKGINFTNDSSTGYLSSSLSTINLNTEEESSASFDVPVATTVNDGIMPATAMRAISDLDIRVTALQSGVQSYFVDFGSDNPSQDALTLLYQEVSGKTDTPPNLTRLIDVARNSYYEYYTSLETHWQGAYIYRYGVATLSQIGLVGSSEQKGEIFVEPVTGVMSLNGYNDIINTFNTLYGGTGRTAIAVSQVPSLPASKITSGALDVARLPIIPISKGGTNNTTFSAYKLVVTGNVDSTTSTPASLVDGPSFGALNTVLVGQGANQLPVFKSREDTGLELVSRKITTWGTPTDVQYPSALLVKTTIDTLDGEVVKKDNDQTIPGIKTFSNYIKVSQIDSIEGRGLVRYKATEGRSVFGNDTTRNVLMGNANRPYYSKSGSDFDGTELALYSDVTSEATARSNADSTLQTNITTETTNRTTADTALSDRINNDATPHTTASITLTVAGWSNKSQTVTITGYDNSKLNTVVPDLASAVNWANCGINASAENSNGITFTCAIVPTVALTFKVVSEKVIS